jgi:hypothetical protein
MKRSLLLAAGVVLLAGVTASAIAQINVYIGTPPPPIRYEVRGPLPYEGAYWVNGYWAPQGHHYRWIPGRWERPPYANAYYAHPHYDHYRQGWKYHEGYWNHDENHDHERDEDDRGHGNGHGHGHDHD